MKLALKSFQDDFVEKLLDEIRSAQRDATRRHQAVAFSAPTGSGKTVMMAAAFERLIEGDASAPPAPHSTFLWITDQPQLNDQTLRRIRSYSTTFQPQQLHIIDSNFDSRVLQSSHLYFLNTQKLGRDKTLVSPSDARTYTFWDTLRATLDDRAQHLFVIVDEAHRGMDLTERQRGEARSIIQKFIVGSPQETVPVPLLVGISATPQRFTALLERTDRVVRPLNVPPEDVRASGLIKDVVRYYVPAVSEPSDISLLREASRCLAAYSRAWHDYCGSSNERSVAPLLMLQVEDAAAGRISRTDIGEALAAVSEELGALPDRAFAHAFQEQTSLSLGGRQVRYLAPSHIESDPDVRIVLFKTSLNTGWDCPRAEVMMSFRRATDSTSIAQLVGRMVRTPLARRITDRELLNRVNLFLPHYNKASVDDVVQRLTSDDDGAPLTQLEDASDCVELFCDQHESLLELVSTLPSYTIPTRTSVHNVHRFMRLARVLEDAQIRSDARDTARNELVRVLLHELEIRRRSSAFRRFVKEGTTLKVRVLSYASASTQEDIAEIPASDENLRDHVDAIGRRVREGIHLAFCKARIASGSRDFRTARLELAALFASSDVYDALMERASQLTAEWLAAATANVVSLPPHIQAQLNEIRSSGSTPELQPIAMPDTLTVRPHAKTKSEALTDHLYQDDAGHFPGHLTSWETATVRAAGSQPGLVAWLRNLPRKPWSLTVPYWDSQGQVKALYPDIIAFHRVDGVPAIDLLDPHLDHLDDAAFKARGLARYAQKHGAMFRSIQLLRMDRGKLQRLDLANETVRQAVLAVTSNEHLRQLYHLLGAK